MNIEKLNNIVLNASEHIQFLWKYKKCVFLHGSRVYGTNNSNSDWDIVVIVSSGINVKCNNNSIYNILEYSIDNIDFQFINESWFCKMLEDHHIIAIESLWMSSDNYLYGVLPGKSYFCLDKWKLRQTISSIVNNSWAKCHKKLTVEKDYDFYRAIKSLFHCLRLYTFGLQIAQFGKIVDYSAANQYWDDLYIHDKFSEHIWKEYKAYYQPILNGIRSEFIKYCPKPKC